MTYFFWETLEPLKDTFLIPRCSMYGIFAYIRVIFGVNVGKYSIHGAYGIGTWRLSMILAGWRRPHRCVTEEIRRAVNVPFAPQVAPGKKTKNWWWKDDFTRGWKDVRLRELWFSEKSMKSLICLQQTFFLRFGRWAVDWLKFGSSMTILAAENSTNFRPEWHDCLTAC